MGLFGKKEPKPTGIIGVDIGAGGIKAVELAKEKGRMRLLTYGYSTMSNPDNGMALLLDDPKQAAKILNEVHKKAGMRSTRVNASLPSNAIFHAIINVATPKNEKEDLQASIEAQVTKLLPMPLKEMVLDSTVIDREFAAEKNRKR